MSNEERRQQIQARVSEFSDEHPDLYWPELVADIVDDLLAQVATHEADWQDLGEMLRSGGMHDPAFLVGMVKGALTDLAAERQAHQQLREQNIWQPIETAPKDGTHVLAWRDSGVHLMRWCCQFKYWDEWHATLRSLKTQPTHWMPLPKAPLAALLPPDRQERTRKD